MTSSDTPDIASIIFSALDSSAMVSVTNVRGRILYASPAFAEKTGYSTQELVGENHRLLKSERQTAEFFDDLWLTISRGSTWRGNITNRHKSGDYYTLDTIIVPVPDQRQRPKYYVAIRFEPAA